jgi:uncharacterized protein (TIGR00369 family)
MTMMQTMAKPPAAQFLGVEPLEVRAESGFARMAFTAPPEFCNYMGVVHGGFLAAMLDDVMAVAAVAQYEFRRAVPTLAMKVSYLRPARPGRLVGEGQVVKAGRELLFIEGRLYDTDDKLLTTASATAKYRELVRS